MKRLGTVFIQAADDERYVSGIWRHCLHGVFRVGLIGTAGSCASGGGGGSSFRCGLLCVASKPLQTFEGQLG